MKQFAVVLVSAIGLLANYVSADEPADDNSTSLSSEEVELVQLADEFSKELRDFRARRRELDDQQEKKSYTIEHDPGIEYLPRLLAFELKHRGQDVGIDALVQVVSHAARSNLPDLPTREARREVLKRLSVYEDRPLVIRAVYQLRNGRYDPLVANYLERLGNSQDAHPTVSAFARYVLAKSILDLRTYRKRMEARLESLAEGAVQSRPNEIADIHDRLSSVPLAQELHARCDVAMVILEDLVKSGKEFQIPTIRTIGPTSWIARVNTKKTETAPYLSEKVAPILFKEKNLRIGKTAPHLELELIDGDKWSLGTLRGKVVIIQFSFTGCGACEEMYPDLRELSAAYPHRLSILSIMRDETDQPSKRAIESGKYTWDVAWDGKPGRIATQWAVTGFPDVYTIDQQQRIVAYELRGLALKEKVAELLREAS